MHIIGIALVIIGALIMLGGGIMILIEAFKTSVMWGIGSLLCGIVTLVFVFTHWPQAKKGFFIWLLGLPIYIIGFVLGGAAAFMQQPPQ